MFQENLPPLPALRTFDAAARHLSFRKAAEELSVTPSAISHHIAKLEDSLGTVLFHRQNRGLSLTDAGATYHARLRGAFDAIREATTNIQAHAIAEILTLCIPPTLLTTWLIPRLSQFQNIAPEIELRLIDSLRVVDFSSEAIDAGIWYGYGDWPDVHIEHLFDEEMCAVCHPGILGKGKQLSGLKDVLQYPLIYTEKRLTNWNILFQKQGITSSSQCINLHFLHSIQAVEAACNGLGIALVNRTNVRDLLDSGKLVAPLILDIKEERKPAYWLVRPAHSQSHTKLNIFAGWLRKLAEIEKAN